MPHSSALEVSAGEDPPARSLETRLDCGSLESEGMVGRQPCAQCLRGTANCLAGAGAVVLEITCAGKHQPCFADRRAPLRIACHTGGNLECLRTQPCGIRSVPGP